MGFNPMAAPMKVAHDTEASIRFLKSKSASGYGLTEMDLGSTTAIGLVRQVFGSAVRTFTKNIGGHSQEIPLVLRTGTWFHPTQFTLTPLTPDVPGGGVGNDRYLAELHFTRFGRKYVWLHTHLDAEIQNHDPRSPNFGAFLNNERWHVTQRAMAVLTAKIQAAKGAADCVIVTGDLNVLPEGEGKTSPASPFRVLRSAGFHILSERVTVLAVWGAHIKSHEVFPPGKNGWGSDHAAILARLTRPTKKH